MFKEPVKKFITHCWGNLIAWLKPPKKKMPPDLLEAAETARKNWRQALYDFRFYNDEVLVEYAIHQINACERRYIAILSEAKKKKITAWTMLEPAYTNDETNETGAISKTEVQS